MVVPKVKGWTTCILLVLWVVEQSTIANVSVARKSRDRCFLSNICNFLVSHFNYLQNQYLLFLTFDRFAAIVSVTRNLKVNIPFFLVIGIDKDDISVVGQISSLDYFSCASHCFRSSYVDQVSDTVHNSTVRVHFTVTDCPWILKSKLTP